jgi:hypothetical protein
MADSDIIVGLDLVSPLISMLPTEPVKHEVYFNILKSLKSGHFTSLVSHHLFHGVRRRKKFNEYRPGLYYNTFYGRNLRIFVIG